MSIRIDAAVSIPPRGMQADNERLRCALIVEGTPLGYRTMEEHEVLENFARKVVRLIRQGAPATESID